MFFWFKDSRLQLCAVKKGDQAHSPARRAAAVARWHFTVASTSGQKCVCFLLPDCSYALGPCD